MLASFVWLSNTLAIAITLQSLLGHSSQQQLRLLQILQAVTQQEVGCQNRCSGHAYKPTG